MKQEINPYLMFPSIFYWLLDQERPLPFPPPLNSPSQRPIRFAARRVTHDTHLRIVPILLKIRNQSTSPSFLSSHNLSSPDPHHLSSLRSSVLLSLSFSFTPAVARSVSLEIAKDKKRKFGVLRLRSRLFNLPPPPRLLIFPPSLPGNTARTKAFV